MEKSNRDHKFFIILMLFLTACGNYKGDKSISSKEITINKVVENRPNSLAVGAYELNINSSCILDTIEKEEHSIVVDQVLTFSENNRKINSFNPSVRRVKYKNNTVPDASIWRISTLVTSIDTLFYIEATGDCEGNLCPQFMGYYSKKGEKLFEGYLTEVDNQTVERFEQKYRIEQHTVENKKRIRLCK